MPCLFITGPQSWRVYLKHWTTVGTLISLDLSLVSYTLSVLCWYYFYIQSHLLFDNRSENEIYIFRDCYFDGAGSGYWRWGYIFLVLKFWSVIQFNSYSSTVNRCDEEPIALRSICKAALPRWYYNKENNECQQFQYGGCGANANIFFTPDDCEKACKKWWTVNGFFGRVNFYQFSIAFMG